MLHNIGHFIGVRGGASEEDFRTFTAFSDNPAFDGEIGEFKDGGVLDASHVMERCGIIKPRDRFIVTPEYDKCVYATERYATCIEADKEKKRCYLIPHAFGEYVGFTKIEKFGTHDDKEVRIDLPCLMHVRKVGVITAKALGGEAGQSFTIYIGSRNQEAAPVPLEPENFIVFDGDTPANTVKMADCDCICSCISLSGDAVEANTGEGYVFCICDTNTSLEYEADMISISDTNFVHIFPTKIYATLSACSWVGVASGEPRGDNRFVVKKNNDTAISTAAVLNGRPTPIEDDGTNVIEGNPVKVVQSVADQNNVKATVKFRLDFEI